MRWYVITSTDLVMEITEETANRLKAVYPASVINEVQLPEYLAARRQRMIYG